MTRPTALAPALLALALVLYGVPASAQEAEAGEKLFSRCKSCHMIVADDGTEIQKGGKVGPNLFGIIGRQAGTYPEFKYGESLVAAGEAGLVWDEAQTAGYTADPTEFLRTFLDDPKAKSKMIFKLPKGNADIAAYLASVGPSS